MLPSNLQCYHNGIFMARKHNEELYFFNENHVLFGQVFKLQ